MFSKNAILGASSFVLGTIVTILTIVFSEKEKSINGHDGFVVQHSLLASSLFVGTLISVLNSLSKQVPLGWPCIGFTTFTASCMIGMWQVFLGNVKGFDNVLGSLSLLELVLVGLVYVVLFIIKCIIPCFCICENKNQDKYDFLPIYVERE